MHRDITASCLADKERLVKHNKKLLRELKIERKERRRLEQPTKPTTESMRYVVTGKREIVEDFQHTFNHKELADKCAKELEDAGWKVVIHHNPIN